MMLAFFIACLAFAPTPAYSSSWESSVKFHSPLPDMPVSGRTFTISLEVKSVKSTPVSRAQALPTVPTAPNQAVEMRCSTVCFYGLVICRFVGHCMGAWPDIDWGHVPPLPQHHRCRQPFRAPLPLLPKFIQLLPPSFQILDDDLSISSQSTPSPTKPQARTTQVSPAFRIPEQGKGILFLDGIKLFEVRQQQITIR